LILVTILVFGLLRIMPGDVLTMKMGDGVVSGQKAKDQIMRELGFDQPLHVQYWNFISAAGRGDLGKSLWNQKPVSELIAKRLPVTLELTSLAILTSLLIAVPVGVLSAIRQDTPLDYLLRSLSIAGLSIPGFWMGTLAVTFPAIWFGWIPPIIFVSLLE